MMGTEIFKIDAPWAEKLTKTRVSFLMTPTVSGIIKNLRRTEGAQYTVHTTFENLEMNSEQMSY